jgi:hypothetical protein
MHSTEIELKVDAYANALREQETLDCTGGSPIAAQAAAGEGRFWLQTKTGLHVVFARLEPAEGYVHLVDAHVLNEPGWFAQAGFSLDPAAGLDVRSSEIAAFGRGRG